MLRNLLLTFGLILTSSVLVFSQSGSLKGKIIDKETREPLPFVNIVVESGGTQAGGTTSDFEGNYIIKPLAPGKYDVKASFVGYRPVLMKGVVIGADQIRFLDIEMESTAEELPEVEIKDYVVPLIDKDQTTVKTTVTQEDIQKMPQRDANAVASTVGGVFSEDGERGNVRGARSDATVMYIDGIRVRGSTNLPDAAIAQVDVVLGGVPAQYGDATGGIINVTTRGPSRKFGFGLEFESSDFGVAAITDLTNGEDDLMEETWGLDPYGYTRVGINTHGPLIKSKKENGQALLGYFLAVDATYRGDGRPTAKGIYRADDETLDYLRNQPLRPSGLESGGTFQNAEFTTLADLNHRDRTVNTSDYGFSVSGKIDVRTGPTINLTFGGNFDYGYRHNYSYYHSLFNFNKNLLVEDYTWRAFGRFTQRFPTAKDSKSFIKNVYYSIQADYSVYNQEFRDPDHEDNLFQYGYLGSFETETVRSFELRDFEYEGINYEDVYVHNGYDDISFTFDPKDYNPSVASYTEQIYDFFPIREGNWENSDQLQLNGGLINGQQPSDVYGLFAAPGTVQGFWQYGVTTNDQFGLNASGAADIGNHELKFGFQYEQRVDRNYGYSATNLWRIMRGVTNFHIEQLDAENPQFSQFNDTVTFDRLYDQGSQRVFDYNLRQRLGLNWQGTDYILIDSYDMDSYTISYYDDQGNLNTVSLGEDIFDIEMFSPDELWNNGNAIVYYRGYDYTGEKLEDQPSFDDFFTETTRIGDFPHDVYTRPIGAFRPIYMAGYIQDKFSFRDLIFNIGVRVDRFDANQKILKDPYSLFPTRTKGDLPSPDYPGLTEGYSVPGNIGDDYVVYVDNVTQPTQIVGYRDEDTWFNAEGLEIADPFLLDVGSGVSPFLVDPQQEVVTADAFEDYEPQVTVMPRVAFSFPISDEALFYAHYDVLTQRPTANYIADPSVYYWFESITGTVNNPNLKPTKTIDYEVGFQQKLSSSSSMNISAFYREMRDDIQVFRFNGAYPKNYTSFNNIDFGTVKGLTITYDLRRTGNVKLRSSYTLQFANGTGSSTTTAAALLAAGLPNFRTTNPLAWDRRHNFNLSIDYRFKGGKNYTGPMISNFAVLENTGFHAVVTGGSGTPYTTQSNVTSAIQGGTRILEGSYFGSRKPWQFRVDVKFDRDFYFGKSEANQKYLNVYLNVLNLFDFHNILQVYPYTGNPDDDGYLSAPEWQRQINEQISPESFRTLYALAIDNPANYSSPRMIRFGLIYNF